MAKTYFVTGIDTDIGKTVVTGLIARYLAGVGKRVITHKPIQTGCTGLSEDILTHREMMGIAPLAEDLEGETCPYVFEKPCSPHLAAEKEGCKVSLNKIAKTITDLRRSYEYVLVEGAGGLCAPMTRETNAMTFVRDRGYPLVIVTSSRLGSLHHSLSLFELVAIHEIPVAAVIYNRFEEEDAEIGDDSLGIIKDALKKYGYTTPVVELGDTCDALEYDFSCLM